MCLGAAHRLFPFYQPQGKMLGSAVQFRHCPATVKRAPRQDSLRAWLEVKPVPQPH